jgi:serine/threonine protein kinase
MNDPRPPAVPPATPPEGATGEWSAATAHELVAPAGPDSPTLTASGTPPNTSSTFEIPNPFARRYTVVRLLGRGGMGAVFQAQDTQLDRPVALKIPAFRDELTPAQKERFFREARSISALRHSNICPVFDVGEEDNVLYFTMAYIEGQPLSALIERGPMDPAKAVELVRKVARAMHAAHGHGTIHRDLKPANILIDACGEPVVMDFGLARRAAWADDSRDPARPKPAADHGLTQFGSVLGTPSYMPPEQARGDVAAVGPRSDIYSLGVILYELLTGRRPFTAADTGELIRKIETEPPPKPSDFYPWLDKGVEAACLKALAKDPTDRFGTMAEFERALKEAVEPELRVVEPPPLPPRVKAPKRKKRRWVIPVIYLAAVLLLLTICVGGPFSAVFWLIDKVENLRDAHSRSDAEWDAIRAFWQAPPADAGTDDLFPTTLPGGYSRTRHDQNATDAELGITLAGRRAFYLGADGDEHEVRAYRATDAEAQAIQAKVQAFVKSVQDGSASGAPNSSRKKAIYSANNPGNRTVTYGFSNSFNQSHEFGLLWYGQGWLFWFRTSVPLKIEVFPSKYLMEVGKRASNQPMAPVPPVPPTGPVPKPGSGQFGNTGG